MLLPDDVALNTGVAGPARRLTRFALLRYMGWATLDQAVSSATNFSVTVLAARELSRRDFGAFGLAFTLSIVVIGVVRASTTEPLLSRPELATGPAQRSTFGAIAGAVVLLAVVVSAILLTISAIFQGVVGRSLLALAIVLPGLCLQDAWRYCFISQGRAVSAVLNDTVWLLAQTGALIGLFSADQVSMSTILLAWGLAGGVAGIFGMAQAGVAPRSRAGREWLFAQRSLGGRYCVEFLIASAANQLTLVSLGTMAGLSALGAVRGAQAFFGPMVVIFSGVFLAVVPMASRIRADPKRLRRIVVVISGVVCICAIGWTLIGLGLPSSIGRQLFGDTWAPTRAVVLPTGLALFAGGIASGPIIGLRSLVAAQASLRARLLGVPLLVLGPTVGAALADAKGYSYGVAGATFASAAIFWWQFTRASAHGPTENVLE